MNKPNIVLDASQLDTFISCNCKFDYRYNRNKVLEAKAAPLDRGSVIHNCLESFYLALKDKLPYNDAVIALRDRFKKELQESELDIDKLNRVEDTLLENVDYWRIYDQRFEIVDVEKPFIYLLAETDLFNLYMTGKIDLIINDDKYTNLPYDHKSFDRDFPVKRLTNQFINYANALNSNYLVINRIGLQKTLPPEQKYKRLIQSYDHIIKEEWKRDIVAVMNTYLDCVANDYWPRNLTSCDKFNRLCEYYDVCDSSGREAKEYKLASNYILTTPWDVSKILNKETK